MTSATHEPVSLLLSIFHGRKFQLTESKQLALSHQVDLFLDGSGKITTIQSIISVGKYIFLFWSTNTCTHIHTPETQPASASVRREESVCVTPLSLWKIPMRAASGDRSLDSPLENAGSCPLQATVIRHKVNL